MTYPPEGCTYLVTYPDGAKVASAEFADEFQFGAWFRQMEDAGAMDRTSRGVHIFAVTTDGRQAIDIMHPRLVRGRLEKRP